MSDEQNDDDKKVDDNNNADSAALQAKLADMEKQFNAIQAKNQELLDEAKKAKNARREQEEAARKAAEESARKSGDVESLEKSWHEKYTKREKELQDALNEQVSQRDQWVRELTVTSAATSLASELAVPGSSKALLPHIERRLAMDIRDGKPVVVVRDADGKASAQTLDDLKKEIANDPAFAPLIVGSKASGSGAGGAKGGSAAPSANRSKMTPAQKAAYIGEHGADAYSNLPD